MAGTVQFEHPPEKPTCVDPPMIQTAPVTQPAYPLHARHEHGGHPVRALGGKSPQYEVLWPHGPQTYPSARKLMRALYNQGDLSHQGRESGMTFGRYFRLNRPPIDEGGPSVLSMFGNEPEQPRVAPVRTHAPKKTKQPRRRCSAKAGRWYRGLSVTMSTLVLFGVAVTTDVAKAEITAPPQSIYLSWADPVEALSVKPTTRKAPRKSKAKINHRALSVSPVSGPIGIDLENRSLEVKKLLFAGFGSRINRHGYDPKDVLQEVYMGLLARNRGTCIFDPSVSSFGHYVHMVCGCILANYHRKKSRRAEHEQVGMYVAGMGDDEPSGMSDAALAASSMGTSAFGHTGAVGVGAFLAGSLEPERNISTERTIYSLSLSLIREGTKNGKLRPEASLALDALPLVHMGMRRSEIAAELKREPNKVGRALSFLRKTTRVWQEEQAEAMA